MGTGVGGEKTCSLKWRDVVCRPKIYGWIGVKDLKLFNKALFLSGSGGY
jgi:hypothetical protein